MIRVGIMQGRLVPPRRHPIQEFPQERWPEEFSIAARIGFDNIEFIFGTEESDIPDHPLLESGCASIRAQVEACGVRVESICADYFMRHPFHSSSAAQANDSLRLLERLIQQASALGVTDIVIPCVDEAALKTSVEQDRLMQRLQPLLPAAQKNGVHLAFELDLNPEQTRRFLDRFSDPSVQINYDVGNSASLGYDPIEEWNAYGRWISSVHIKDRLMGGGTVPLGGGAARFDRFFQAVGSAGYKGLFTLQGARGQDSVQTAVWYREFLLSWLEKTFQENFDRARA